MFYDMMSFMSKYFVKEKHLLNIFFFCNLVCKCRATCIGITTWCPEYANLYSNIWLLTLKTVLMKILKYKKYKKYEWHPVYNYILVKCTRVYREVACTAAKLEILPDVHVFVYIINSKHKYLHFRISRECLKCI